MNTNHPIRLLLGALLFIFSLSALAQGNGADRGGGDNYVAEFRNIKNRIDAHIKSWVADGTLELSSEELDKYFRFTKTVEIYSLDRVYRVENDPNTEVSFVNMPANPQVGRINPIILIGRIRWDEFLASATPLDVELMVLHELLSASGIRDGKYEYSYRLKLQTINKWSVFKSHIKTELQHITDLKLATLDDKDAALIDTFFRTAFLDNDYVQCLANKGTSKKKIKKQSQYCLGFFNKVTEALVTTMRDHMFIPNIEARREKSRRIDELKQSFKSYPLKWNSWAGKIVDTYSSELDQIDEVWKKEMSGFVDKFHEQCSGFRDMANMMECFVNSMQNNYVLSVRKVYLESRADVDIARIKASAYISEQANPL